MTVDWETQSLAAWPAPPSLFPSASHRRTTMSKHHLTAALREMETQTQNPVSAEFCYVQTGKSVMFLVYFSFIICYF